VYPVLFKLGPLEIQTYGFITAIAFLAGIYLAAWTAQKRGLNKEYIFDLGLVIIICAILGARLLYVLEMHAHFLRHPLDIVKVWEGGLIFHGGLIAAVAGSFAYLKVKKLDVLAYLDTFAPFAALGHSIARIGCYFAGCCYGKVDEACGVVFPAVGDNLPHLPVQLYESAANFVNFLILIILLRFSGLKKGTVLWMYLANYGIIRFVIEHFRGDYERGMITENFSIPMLISIALFVTGAAGTAWVNRKNGKTKKII